MCDVVVYLFLTSDGTHPLHQPITLFGRLQSDVTQSIGWVVFFSAAFRHKLDWTTGTGVKPEPPRHPAAIKSNGVQAKISLFAHPLGKRSDGICCYDIFSHAFGKGVFRKCYYAE